MLLSYIICCKRKSITKCKEIHLLDKAKRGIGNSSSKSTKGNILKVYQMAKPWKDFSSYFFGISLSLSLTFFSHELSSSDVLPCWLAFFVWLCCEEKSTRVEIWERRNNNKKKYPESKCLARSVGAKGNCVCVLVLFFLHFFHFFFFLLTQHHRCILILSLFANTLLMLPFLFFFFSSIAGSSL